MRASLAVSLLLRHLLRPTAMLGLSIVSHSAHPHAQGEACARNLLKLKGSVAANIYVYNRSAEKVGLNRCRYRTVSSRTESGHGLITFMHERCAAVAALPQCAALVQEGALLAASPAECMAKCDYVFAMLADPEAALQVGG